MNRYAILEGNKVVNVALWDGQSEWNPGGEIVKLPNDSPVGPGYTRVNVDFIAPMEKKIQNNNNIPLSNQRPNNDIIKTWQLID